MDAVKTVSMTSIAPHTFDAIEREPGTVYDVDPQYVETLEALRFARRTDSPARGGKRKATAPGRETASTAVSPMTTEDVATHKS